MATWKTGKNGTVKIGGTERPITRWNFDPSHEVARFRNSMTGNFDAKETTFGDGRGSFELDWDSSANPLQGPPLIKSGDKLTDLVLWLDKTATSPADRWALASAIVVGTPMSLDVGGKIVTTVNFENDGAWKQPGEA